MEAVKMPDGMYAYRMVSYDLGDGTDLVATGVFDTDPSIPGPTIVMDEYDTADITLTNNACDENFVDGGVGSAENFYVGMHTHGVHYDITDDATYDRMNMAETGAADCNSSVQLQMGVQVLELLELGLIMITHSAKTRLEQKMWGYLEH